MTRSWAAGLETPTVERYMSGLCHALALAFHREWGWGLVAVRGTEGGEDCIAHVAVLHPDDPGLAIDVRGMRELADLRADYPDLSDAWIQDVDEAVVLRWVAQDRLHDIDADDAQDAARVARHISARMPRG